MLLYINPLFACWRCGKDEVLHCTCVSYACFCCGSSPCICN